MAAEDYIDFYSEEDYEISSYDTVLVVGFKQLKRQTKMAMLCRVGDEDHWLPKSAAHVVGKELWVELWIAQNKDLDYEDPL